MGKMTRHAKALRQMLIDLGYPGVHHGTQLRIARTYVGHWQRSAGAWTWVGRTPQASAPESGSWKDCSGSQFSVTELLREHKHGNVSLWYCRVVRDYELLVERRATDSEGGE